MRLLLIAFALSFAIALVACGDDDDDEGVSTATPTTSTVTPTVRVSAGVSTVAPGDTEEPTEAAPPVGLTDAMIDAVVQYVADNDFLSARREMTDPPVCDDTEDNPDHLGKVCIVNAPLTFEGANVFVRAGIYRSDGVLELELQRDGQEWTVVEARDPNDVGLTLTDEMIDAIAAYVAANDMFGERREMTDPPRCGDALDDALAFAGKVCVVEGTFTVTPQNVLVNAGLWSSDAVLTMTLKQVDEAAWAVTEVRE